MSSRKVSFVLTMILVLLLGLVSISQAAPPVPDEDSNEETLPGSSLGEKLSFNNLGTIMSGKGSSSGDTTGDSAGEKDGIDNPDDTADDPNDGSDVTAKEHPVASAMAEYFADYFGVTHAELYAEIMELHLTGNGFGAIAKAYFFADKLETPLTPQELLAAAHGSGWGNVLKAGGLHPGSVGNGGVHSNRPGHAGQPAQASQAGPPGQLKKGDPDDSLSPAGLVGPGGGNGHHGQGNQGNGNGNGQNNDKGGNGNNGRGHGRN
jgi:hypothetical protein